jgi:non-canonical purine NTP pyrophosphatase (RdgB/HAM1 family)
VRLVLATGNERKLEEARRIVATILPELTRELPGLGGEALSLERVDVDLPEIQSMSLVEVLEAKGEEAWRQLGGDLPGPLVVEETGFELEALGGFPGPLIKWMLGAVGAEGVARTALALGNPRAVARCALLYRDGSRRVVAEGVCPGELTLPPRGDRGWGWDPVFIPQGESHTVAELGPEVKDRLGHRGLAWRDLLRRLGRGL